MSNDLNSKPKTTTRRLAWVAGILCAGCCAVPLVGIAMGSAAVAGLAVYSEKIALAAAAVSLVAWLVYTRTRSQRAASYDLECGCGKKQEASQG